MKEIILLISITGTMLIQGCKKTRDLKPSIPDQSLYSKEDYTLFRLDSTDIIQFINTESNNPLLTEYLIDFYARRNYQTGWYTECGLSESAQNFYNWVKINIKEMQYLDPYLDPTIKFLDAQNMNPHTIIKDPKLIKKIELSLSILYFSYATKAYQGQDFNLPDLEWYIPRKKKDINKLLQAIYSNELNLEDFEPINSYYKGLRKALIQMKKDSSHLDSLKTVIEGIDVANISETDSITIFNYLYFSEKANNHHFENKYLDSLIKLFQERHGLKTDGKFNTVTKYYMTIPVSKYIEKILINMERMRWLPDSTPSSFLLVNIPEFKIHVFENHQLLWSSDIVVGSTVNKTSIFNGRISNIVFNPYWNVPLSIVQKELLPILKRDPRYLERNQMEAFKGTDILNANLIDWKQYKSIPPFQIRQKPGTLNALGKVKFIFPNEFSIYLHDTPSKSKFKETRRDFSHGCIRLSEPIKLAQHVLKNDSTLNLDKIRLILKKGKEQWVAVNPALEVNICYLTSWVDSKGILNFREDIYGHDSILFKTIYQKRNIEACEQ